MTRLNLHGMLAASACAGSLLLAPSESKAIFHWCRGCGAAPVVAPAPVYAPPPPAVSYYAPCAPPTVVNYVPQTYYRPVSVNMPVTTYQPVSSCGLCGPTTVMRPVTTMVQQTRYVPYTSYRLVYSPAPAAYAVGYAPMPMAAPVVAAPAVAAPMVAAPAAPACCAPAATGAPSLSAAPVMSAPTAPGTTTYAAPGSTTYSTPGTTTYSTPGTTTYGSQGTTTYGSQSGAGYPPGRSPASPSSGGDAPAYNPNQTSPPDIHVPTDPQIGPASAPQRQMDSDGRTAARPISATAQAVTSGVVPASSVDKGASTDGWRPSSR